MAVSSSPRVLDASQIIRTVERLAQRISERFPGSSLTAVCQDLVETARGTAEHVEKLAMPFLALRALAALVAAVGLAAEFYAASFVHWSDVLRRADAVALSQGLDSAVNLLLLSFAGIWFVLTLETRLKRRSVLKDMYVLRSLAHVVDMHQLTKDPTVLLGGGGTATASSPSRRMSEFELSRYLDYCSEMLALIAKLAALYAAQVEDQAVIAAVGEVEELTSDLGRKIWQKIMIISRLDETRGART